jgi:hypothetical protein
VASSNKQLWWYGLSALYAMAIIGVSLLWPGPGAAPPMPAWRKPPAPATPPVDTSTAPSYFSRTSAEGSARVFWSMPENGEVKMTIEIPPENTKVSSKHRP